jgi:transposase
MFLSWENQKMGTKKLERRHWQLSDELWSKIKPLIPPRQNPHPRGGGKKPADNRTVMQAILLVLSTGMQWNALNDLGGCPSSTAHDRFQKWCEQGVFVSFWQAGLLEYDELKGIDWEWQSMDGAITKAPLGGKKKRPQPH